MDEFSKDRIARVTAISAVRPFKIYRDMTDKAESACEGETENFCSLCSARVRLYCTTWLERRKEKDRKEGGERRERCKGRRGEKRKIQREEGREEKEEKREHMRE